MKRMAWLLILFIGMISFTGFSSTADLTKNSDIVFSADNDVGALNAIIVDNNVFKTNVLEIYFNVNQNSLHALKSNENSTKESLIFTRQKLNILVPWQKNITTFNYKILNYRIARDAL